MRACRRAFSLAELLVALGLISVAILGLLALSIALAKGNQEGIDKTIGAEVAAQLTDRLVAQLRADAPPGVRNSFWLKDDMITPWDSGTLQNNGTTYNYKIYAENVRDTSGNSIGGTTAGNRLKKVDVHVWWWDSETKAHQGYGELKVLSTRLVSEAETGT